MACALGGLVAFVAATSLPLRLAALAVSTFGSMGLGTLGHTASHEALTPWRAVDRLVLHLLYPLFLGLSATYWRHSHVVVHHRAPGVSGVDADTDLRPLLALDADHLRDNGGLRARRPALQLAVLLALLPFNAFLMQLQAAMHLARQARRPGRRRRALAVDLACLAAHYALWLALPSHFFPAAAVLALYAVRQAALGIGLFAILAPGHYPAVALCIAPELHAELPHVVRQAATTSNFRTGPLGRWLCSGLEQQIEHHLLPHLSHVQLRRIAPIVRAYLEEHGVPYHELGWAEALRAGAATLLCPRPVLRDRHALARAFAAQRRIARASTVAPIAALEAAE
jgi:fatty acid desaturase